MVGVREEGGQGHSARAYCYLDEDRLFEFEKGREAAMIE